VTENPYNQIAYRTFPRRQTHPDRLAAVARLFGMESAAVTQCRVLEVGCGSGGNLIPMAYALPGSRFTGIDLAEAPVSIARETVHALELKNLDVRVADVCEFENGEFDYVLVHGLYSWGPARVRDRLLALCGERLAPNGVAFVSYNAYPGQHERQMFREMLRYRGDSVESAREFLRGIAHEEAAALAASPDDILYHDILAPINHAVYFHEFADHARQHGLRYLGEADPHDMFDETGALLDEAGEQQQDFRRLRRFRQTLLCREGATLDRSVGPERMERFLFSQNAHGRRIAGADAAVEAVAQALSDVYPLPVEFAELEPYAGSREALGEMLLAMLAAGCVNLHVHDFPCAESVSERPRASALARYQARAGSQVTGLCHMPVQLDEVARRLLVLLDGNRTEAELARELARVQGSGGVREIRRALPGSLAWLAGMGLLER
jgi:SAM-dependent methyltransferase